MQIRRSAVILAAILLLAPAMVVAATFPACDNFGQDWKITLGAFGGTFPGTQLVSGCRDCNASLGCGGPLPLDGTVVVTQASNRIWSVTAYRPAGSSCVSTHWTGAVVGSGSVVSGNVSNESGPFGAFTLTLRSACGAVQPLGDPSTHPGAAFWQPEE